MITCLKNCRLVQDGTITSCDILMESDRIIQIRTTHQEAPWHTVIDLNHAYVSAGFIDLHVHGGGGADFMDGAVKAWHTASAMHLKYGTTALLPTTTASSAEELLKTFEVFSQCKNSFQDGAKLLGLHLEGPYLSPEQCGAMNSKNIRQPDPDEYKMLVHSCPDIRRWTIAPELEGALKMAKYITAQGILPSIGHSNATYEEVTAACASGFRHVTHLYSAMSTIVRKQGFRYPGVVESAYLIDGLTSEIIADGFHLPPALLQFSYRFIGTDRLILVTDAMRGAGMPEGESILGSIKNGQKVLIEDGVAKLPDRSAFAGSVATADRLVHNMVALAGAALPEAIKMITENPAKVLGIADTFGRIDIGRAADIVVFDEKIQVLKVFLDGTQVH